MADDLDPELQTDLGTREDVAGDVRASIASLSDLGDKLKEPAPVTETVEQKAERVRDESGKFVAKDKVDAPVAAAPKEITDADQPTEKPVQQSRADGPPRGWSADEKATWSTLPPAIQAAVSRRESEINEGARQWSEQRQTYERVLSPVAELSQQNGLSVEDGITRLLTVERRLASDGPNMIRELAQAYGVDLVALVNGSPQPQPQQAAQQFDPNVIPQLINQSLSQALAQRDEQTALQRTIDDFQRQPGHEHFAEVKVLMGHLLTSQQATDMQDAYDKAVWANPATREKLQSLQASPQIANVAKAKKAAVSLNGSPRGAAPVNRNGSVNGSVIDDVRAAFASARGDA